MSTLATPLSAVPAVESREEAAGLRLSRRGDLLSLSLLLVLVLAILGINFWSRYNLYRLDIITFYLPWYEHLGERLRDADIPGWMPYAMSGSPFAGDPQSGWGYLPAMFFFTIAPSLGGYIAFVAFHVALAAVGSYLYARVIGINPIGSFAAGVIFTLSNFMERTACCTIHMQVAVWIPLIFLTYELSRRARSTVARYGWLVATGIGAGQMISGWVGQGAYYGCLAVGIYIFYRTVLSRGEFASVRARLVSIGLTALVVGVVGAATAGPALIPRFDTVSRSNLADLYEADEEVVADGEPDEEVVSGWEPEAIPFRVATARASTIRWYLGIAALSLAIIGACVAIRRRHVLFFTVFGVGALVLILRDSPLLDLFNQLPRFESLHRHSPDRIYVVLFLVPAVLAGWLVHTVSDRSWHARHHVTAVILGAGLAIDAVVAAAVIVRHPRPIDLDDRQFVLAGLAIGVAILALTIRIAPIRRLAAVALILLLVYDPAGRLTADRAGDKARRERLDQLVDRTLTPNGAARWLQERAEAGELFRYFGYDQVQLMNRGELRTYHVSHSQPETWRLLVNNRGIPFHLQDIQGYNPVQIKKYVELFDAINTTEQSYHAANVLAGGLDSPLLDLLNVRYIVIPREYGPGRPDLAHLVQRLPTVYSDEDTRILENPNALPRAWIVHEAEQEEGDGENPDEDILSLFAIRLADPAETVLLTGEPPELEEVGDDAAESVEVISYEADEIRLRVTAEATGMVVLGEVWDPGWKATVDGTSTKLYPADAVFRGVVVEPGTHEIVLRYPATSAKASLLLYLIPLLALLGIPIARRRWPNGASG
jgi:hypothetical protein